MSELCPCHTIHCDGYCRPTSETIQLDSEDSNHVHYANMLHSTPETANDVLSHNTVFRREEPIAATAGRKLQQIRAFTGQKFNALTLSYKQRKRPNLHWFLLVEYYNIVGIDQRLCLSSGKPMETCICKLCKRLDTHGPK